MTGAQGSTMAGVAGATGAAGATGPQGPIGPTGPQGRAGVIQWTSYRDFWFDADKAAIHDADWHIVTEIAAYMKNNPSLQLGIDGSTYPRATQWQDQNLCDRRVGAIRDALISAGVPVYRISEGMFGDVTLRRNGRVEVLLRTQQLSQAK
jgi:outer membrane protein OmpA-like peptidoglycan-associated protein